MKTAQRTGALIAVLTILVIAALFAVMQTAWGTGQDTCPEGGGWVKVDDLDGLTYTFDVPDGFTVTDNCFKAATTLVFGTGPTVTNTTVVNKNGQLQDISHASFLLVEDTSSTTTTTTPETTTTGEPTTTTTESETTTTSGDTTTTSSAGSSTVPPESTTTTSSTPPTSAPPATPPTNPELPFTGAGGVTGLVLLASALAAGGLELVRRGRSE